MGRKRETGKKRQSVVSPLQGEPIQLSLPLIYSDIGAKDRYCPLVGFQTLIPLLDLDFPYFSAVFTLSLAEMRSWEREAVGGLPPKGEPIRLPSVDEDSRFGIYAGRALVVGL